MKAWSCRYELQARRALGGRATVRARAGALLMFEHPGVGIGYADCHPWEELGDAPLGEQLRALSEGRLTPLLRASFELSRQDAVARARGRSCFEGLSIPRSHFLVTDRDAAPAAQGALRALEEGFDLLKLKLGRELGAEVRLVRSLIERIAGRGRIRLDFNSLLGVSELNAFLDGLGPDLAAVDFIEDPLPWSERDGFPPASGVRFALDREAGRLPDEGICPPVLIVKPAIHDWRAIVAHARRWRRSVVVTSYLDHPLGQLSAAWAAAQAALEAPGNIETCGLLSHGAFEPSEFSEALPAHGPRLEAPLGTGFGLDELLRRRDWRRAC